MRIPTGPNGQIKLDGMSKAAIAVILVAGLAQAFRSSTPPVVAVSPTAITATVAPGPDDAPGVVADTATDASAEPPGLDDAPPVAPTPDVTVSPQTPSGILRVYVGVPCDILDAKGKRTGKQTECTGVSLRRLVNQYSTPDTFAVNSARVRRLKSVPGISHVMLQNEDGSDTGKVGWIDDRFLVVGS